MGLSFSCIRHLSFVHALFLFTSPSVDHGFVMGRALLTAIPVFGLWSKWAETYIKTLILRHSKKYDSPPRTSKLARGYVQMLFA